MMIFNKIQRQECANSSPKGATNSYKLREHLSATKEDSSTYIITKITDQNDPEKKAKEVLQFSSLK